MRFLAITYGLLCTLFLMPGPDSGQQEELRALKAEKERLERRRAFLSLEDTCARSGEVYLLVDGEGQQLAARTEGVLLRSARILWMYGPADPGRAGRLSRVAQWGVEWADSAATDSAEAHLAQAPRAPLAFWVRLEDGSVWRIAGRAEPQGWWEELKSRLLSWEQSLPGRWRRGEVHLYVPQAEMLWIQAVARQGTRVLIAPREAGQAGGKEWKKPTVKA
jgi:hypothetical protein